MIVELFLLSIIIGMIRGGSLVSFYRVFSRRTWVITLGLLVYTGTFYFGIRGYSLVLKNIEKIYLLSYFIIVLGIIMNIKYREVFIVGVGAIMNFIVYIYNSRSVPILKRSLEALGLDNGINIETIFFVDMVEGTKLKTLGHIISIPKPYPYPQIISLGDLIMAIGFLLLIQKIMLSETRTGLRGISFKK